MRISDWSSDVCSSDLTWFPLAHSSSIGQKPVRRAIYSHPYFIWRENGIAVASEFHPNERQTRDKSAYTDAHGRSPVMEPYGYLWGWLGRQDRKSTRLHSSH